MGSADVPRIRIALLGADAGTPALARAIVEHDRFELAGVCELEGNLEPHAAQSLRVAVGRARRLDVWEALLDSTAIDAVVVARAADQDRRAEQLRKLIQAEVPLLVSHPVVDSMLVYYELDMIRRETGGLVLPHLPERHHQAVRNLAQMVRQGVDSPIGKIEQVAIERSIVRPVKESVLSQFARDVDLVRAIAGDMTRLGAMAAAGGEAAYGSLGVHMSGPEGVVARWSVVPTQAAAGAQITLLGANGKVLVEVRSPERDWTMALTADGQTQTRQYDPWNPAAASLEELSLAMRGQPCEPQWVDAARSVEFAETIDRSLRKGRTIELYYEEFTEEGTFKGTMTSIGCGLLVLATFVLGAAAIGEQMGLPYVRYWPYFLLGSFGLFLLMQLLMLAKGRHRDVSPDESSPKTG